MAENSILASVQAAIASKKENWTAAHNYLLELDEESRRARLGYNPGPGELSLAEREAQSSTNLKSAAAPGLGATPASWDWRNVNGRNFISSVKNQGQCGSCVAFGTCAAIEGMVRTITGVAVNDAGGGALPDLSEAQLFFCGAGQNCAVGWNVGSALTYATNSGVATEGCFPYSDHNQACSLCPNWQNQVTQVAVSGGMNSVAQMKTWLSTNGPLITCFSVYADFYAYDGGVYRHVDGAYEGGHCVACIGYDDTKQAWLCKNSWGTGWGEGGYFWIAYGQCGIDAYMWSISSFAATYPLYSGMMMRTNLSDIGQIPSPSPASSSPDIIPYGTMPDPNPQVTFTENWRTDPGKPVYLAQENFLYVRGQNLTKAGLSGDYYLYYSKASLLLWPSTWSANGISTTKGGFTSPFATAAEGDIGVGTLPFLWNPAALGSDDHYCLISRAVTPATPNPIPADFATFDQFVSWIVNNPNNAWRNVTTITGDTPTVQVNVNLLIDLAQSVGLFVMLQSANIPAGVSVQFACGTPGPNPPLDMQKSTITNPVSQVFGVYSAVPANFDSNIVVSMWNNGITISTGASLSLIAFYLVAPGHELEAFASPIPRVEGKGYGDGVSPQQGIEVGRFSILVQ